MNSYKILVESKFDEIEYKEELCEKTNTKKLYIEGITLQANIKNRNGRIYPGNVLDEAVNKYIESVSSIGATMEGELKHPKDNVHEINEDRISHRFINVVKDGDNWRTKSLVLDTAQGLQVQKLFDGGVKLGISSRALGNVKKENGIDMVQDGLKIICLGDIVKMPSAPNAMIDAIYENKEFIYEAGVLVEKDLSEDLDLYKTLINKTTKKDRAKIFEKIVLDYFNKIGIKTVL